MAEFKLIINDAKTGKSYKKAADEQESSGFSGLKIGSKIKGDSFGFKGYEFEIKGGSDKAGFPMRSDIEGTTKRKILTTKSIGVKNLKGHGQRRRKTVAGNTVYDYISQINLSVVNYGAKSIEDILGIKKEEASPEAQAEEAKTEAA